MGSIRLESGSDMLVFTGPPNLPSHLDISGILATFMFLFLCCSRDSFVTLLIYACRSYISQKDKKGSVYLYAKTERELKGLRMHCTL